MVVYECMQGECRRVQKHNVKHSSHAEFAQSGVKYVAIYVVHVVKHGCAWPEHIQCVLPH